ncbi:MAG: DUF2442 domain-containing protein [Bacteroidetes bacterium]|nr:DUF2442 domain-containing protein [Bacteroidota bacterium]MBU2584550.1 DUF2442 domain-containing protein [Bacteroidota bacterium]
MKITEEYTILTEDTEVIDITSARYIGDYAIRLTFSDGFEKLVDFKPFLSKSLHPSIRKYLDENLFSKFEIIDGNLNWNDYDLIFPIDDLYNGKI